MKVFPLLCIAMVGIGVGTEARGAAGRDYEVTYYAERQLQTYVGRFYKPCGTGAATLSGHRTRYFTKSQSSCLIIGGPRGQTLSCHFTDAGCTDALVRGFPIFSLRSTSAPPSLFQLSAADRKLYERNQRDSGMKGK